MITVSPPYFDAMIMKQPLFIRIHSNIYALRCKKIEFTDSCLQQI